MKILKNSIKIISFISLIFAFTSCVDDDKDIFNGVSKSAPFPKFVNANPPATVGVQDTSEITYSFSIEDPNNTIVSYDLSMYADIGGVRTDTVAVSQTTSFPSDFSFDANSIADLLGITVSDLGFGDQFFFSATATNAAGEVYGADRISITDVTLEDGTTDVYLDDDGDEVELGVNDVVYQDSEGNLFVVTGNGSSDDLLDEGGYRQAYEFNFIVLCPSVDFSVFPGTWNVDFHRFDAFFGPQGNTREIVLGPGDGQITIVGGAVPLDGADDLILNIDSSSGISYGGEDDAIHFNTFGPGIYGDDVTGLVFTCINRIQIVITSPGFIPNFLNLER